MPLITLLGHAHDALEAEFDERLKASPFSDISLAHSRNVLRHLGLEGCCRVSQLTERSGVSKQALSRQIAHLEKTGYLLVTADPDDGRAKTMELTDRGKAAQRFVGRTMREMDATWIERWGEEAWGDLRARVSSIAHPPPG